jgi:hypothetical protein
VEKSRKSKPPVTHKPAYVAQILHECGGITKDAANKLNMRPETVRSYIKRFPVVKDAREEALNDLKQIATENLIEWVKEKDKGATYFVLSRFRQKDGTWTYEREEEKEDKEEPLEFVLG